VLDLLHELNETGRTIIMVLHDLNQACRYAHNIVAMREGQICVQGEPHDVMTEAMVADVFRVQARIAPDPVTGTPMCFPLGRTKMPRLAHNGHVAQETAEPIRAALAH